MWRIRKSIPRKTKNNHEHFHCFNSNGHSRVWRSHGDFKTVRVFRIPADGAVHQLERICPISDAPDDFLQHLHEFDLGGDCLFRINSGNGLAGVGDGDVYLCCDSANCERRDGISGKLKA